MQDFTGLQKLLIIEDRYDKLAQESPWRVVIPHDVDLRMRQAQLCRRCKEPFCHNYAVQKLRQVFALIT
jgi:hypothetical protein